LRLQEYNYTYYVYVEDGSLSLKKYKS